MPGPFESRRWPPERVGKDRRGKGTEPGSRAMRSNGSSPAILVYDGKCGLCRATVPWLHERAIPGSLEFVDCRSPERLRLLPQVEEERCLRAVLLALPDGRILEGEEAIPEILDRTRRWRWMSRALRLPGVDRLSSPAYRWVAQNRMALSHLLGV